MKNRELLIWEENNGINAEIHLNHNDENDLYEFRNLLSEQIKNYKNLEIIKDEYFPTKFDSNFILIGKDVFSNANQEVKALRDSSPKEPTPSGFLDFLLRRKKYRENLEIYKKRDEIENKVWKIISPLAQVIIQTTHDYPYLDCRSKIHKKEEFIDEIKTIARKLDINLNIINKKPR